MTEQNTERKRRWPHRNQRAEKPGTPFKRFIGSVGVTLGLMGGVTTASSLGEATWHNLNTPDLELEALKQFPPVPLEEQHKASGALTEIDLGDSPPKSIDAIVLTPEQNRAVQTLIFDAVQSAERKRYITSRLQDPEIAKLNRRFNGAIDRMIPGAVGLTVGIILIGATQIPNDRDNLDPTPRETPVT
jgi:hypothetical protein